MRSAMSRRQKAKLDVRKFFDFRTTIKTSRTSKPGWAFLHDRASLFRPSPLFAQTAPPNPKHCNIFAHNNNSVWNSTMHAPHGTMHRYQPECRARVQQFQVQCNRGNSVFLLPKTPYSSFVLLLLFRRKPNPPLLYSPRSFSFSASPGCVLKYSDTVSAETSDHSSSSSSSSPHRCHAS